MREKQTEQPGTEAISQPPITEKTSFLAQSPMFRELNAQDISALDQSITALTCQPGHLIYRPGEASTALFFIKTGRVQLYHLSTDGRKLITVTLNAGACFGEQVLYTPQISTSFAEVLTLACLYVLNKAELNQLLAHNAAITTALLQLVGQRLTHMETQLVSTTFKSVTTRLAELLLQLATPATKGSAELSIDGLSHEELADRLGVYRETVSTALRELKEAHAIQIGRKHIVIRQPDLLQQLAQTGGKAGLHRREY